MVAINNRDLAHIGLRVSPANFEERVRAALRSLPATPLAPVLLGSAVMAPGGGDEGNRGRGCEPIPGHLGHP